MNKSIFIYSFLFVICALSFYACKKDTQEPNTQNPVSEIPEGGTVSGIYTNETLVDSFMMSDVTGRLTSQGGLSFLASNNSYQLLFLFPAVNDTGLYGSLPLYNKFFKFIDNGDTTSTFYSPITFHVTQYDQFSNYTLISGTFKIQYIEETANQYRGEISEGIFTNIPLVHNGAPGNYVIYQGEHEVINSSEVMVADNFFFSKFQFDGIALSSMQYDRTNGGHAGSGMNPYSTLSSQMDISQIDESEQTVSGWIKIEEEYDLELHFQDTEYMSLPELEDGQMAMLFNFGEVIMYFDSAKCEIPEFPSNMFKIYGYYGSNVLRLSAPYDPQAANPIHGQTFLYNTGFPFLESLINGYSHRSFSANLTKMSFEFGRVMGSGVGSGPYNQLYIEGKNIPIRM